MPKKATKASDNIFYIARMAAAKSNERLCSREGAGGETGIDRTRLARIELGALNPYPEEVLMLSEAYNAPELASHYCSQMCPLGKKTAYPAELQDLDRLTIRIITALGEAAGVDKVILKVAADGQVTPDESGELLFVAQCLEKIAVSAQELKIWAEKHLKKEVKNE